MAFDARAYLQSQFPNASTATPQQSVSTPVATAPQVATKAYDRQAFLSKYQAYVPQPEPMGAMETGAKSALSAVVPTAGFVGGMRAGLALPIPHPVGKLAAGLVGGLIGSFLGSATQDIVAKKVIGKEDYDTFQKNLAEARKEHPVAGFVGELAPSLGIAGPSLENVKKAGKFAKVLWQMNKGQRTKLFKTDVGIKHLDNLGNVGMGGGLGLTMEGINQIREGDLQPLRLMMATGAGLLLNKPTKFSEKALGFKDPFAVPEQQVSIPVRQTAQGSPDPAISSKQAVLIDAGVPEKDVYVMTQEQLDVALQRQAEALNQKLNTAVMPEQMRTGQSEMPLPRTEPTPEELQRDILQQPQMRLPMQEGEAQPVFTPREGIKEAPSTTKQLNFADIQARIRAEKPNATPTEVEILARIEADIAQRSAEVKAGDVKPAEPVQAPIPKAEPIVEANKPVVEPIPDAESVTMAKEGFSEAEDPATKPIAEPKVAPVKPAEGLKSKQPEMVSEQDAGFKLVGEKGKDDAKIIAEREAEAKAIAEAEKKQGKLDFDNEQNSKTWDKANKAKPAYRDSSFKRTPAESVVHHANVERELSKIPDVGDVVVIRTPADLPPQVANDLMAEWQAQGIKASIDDVSGVIHNGKKYIISDNVKDVAQAKQKLAHEYLHERIDGANKDDMTLLLGRTYQGSAPAIHADLVKRGYKAGSPEYLHELIASAYEKGVTQGDTTLWNRFVATMRQLMRKWGVKMDISDNDLKVIANRYLANDVKDGLGFINLLDVPFGREALSLDKPVAGARLVYDAKQAGMGKHQIAKGVQEQLETQKNNAIRAANRKDMPLQIKMFRDWYAKEYPAAYAFTAKGLEAAREMLKDIRRTPAIASYHLEQNLAKIGNYIPENFRDMYSNYREMMRTIEIITKKEPYAKLKNPDDEIPVKFTYDQAQNYINDIKEQYPEQFKKFEKADKAWRDIVQPMLKEKLDLGIISQEAYRNMMLLDSSYHPRIMLKYLDANSTSGYKSGQPTLTGIKSLEGSDLDMLNDWRYAMAQIHQRHYASTAAQRLNKLTVDSIKTHGNPLDVRLSEPTQKEFIDRKWDKILYMENGERKEMWMPREFSEGYLNSEPLISKATQDIISWMSGKKIVQAMATGLNPAFALVNIPVDMLTQFLGKDAYSENMVKAFGQMLRNMKDSVKEAWNVTGDTALIAKQGGLMNTMTNLGSIKRELGSSGMARKFDDRLNAFQDVMGRFGQFSELVNRTAYLKQARKKWLKAGRSAQEATELATREAMAIIDYNQAGRWARAIDSALPYFNANLQAAATIGKGISRDPKVFAYKASQLIAFGAMLGYFNRKFRSKEMDSMTDQERKNNVVLPTGVSFKDQQGNERHVYAQFRVAQQGRVFKQIGEEIGEAMAGGNPSSQRIRDSLQDLIPFKVDAFMPPTLKAFVTYASNKDFFNNKDIWMGAKVEPFAEYTAYTPKPFIDFGKATGMSPERTKKAVEQLIVPSNIFTAMIGMGYDALVPKDDQINKEMATKIMAMPMANKVFRVTKPQELTQRQILEARQAKIDVNKEAPQAVAKKLQELDVQRNTVSAQYNAEIDKYVAKIKRKESNIEDFRTWLKGIPNDQKQRAIQRFREKMALTR